MSLTIVPPARRDLHIEVLDDPEFSRPVPEVDFVSAVYFEALAAGCLLIQECPRCGHRQHYPRLMCTVCAAEPDWLQVAGVGSVYTHTTVPRPSLQGFDPGTPYVIAMIELDAGPRLMGNIERCAAEEIVVGQRVRAVVHRVRDDIGILQWTPEGMQ